MKATKQSGAKTPAQQTARLSCRISEEAYQRLFVSSVMSKTTASEIVERAILATCREWSLPGKISDRVAKSHRHDSASEVNLNEPPAPLAMAS